MATKTDGKCGSVEKMIGSSGPGEASSAYALAQLYPQAQLPPFNLQAAPATSAFSSTAAADLHELPPALRCGSAFSLVPTAAEARQHAKVLSESEDASTSSNRSNLYVKVNTGSLNGRRFFKVGRVFPLTWTDIRTGFSSKNVANDNNKQNTSKKTTIPDDYVHVLAHQIIHVHDPVTGPPLLQPPSSLFMIEIDQKSIRSDVSTWSDSSDDDNNYTAPITIRDHEGNTLLLYCHFDTQSKYTLITRKALELLQAKLNIKVRKLPYAKKRTLKSPINNDNSIEPTHYIQIYVQDEAIGLRTFKVQVRIMEGTDLFEILAGRDIINKHNKEHGGDLLNRVAEASRNSTTPAPSTGLFAPLVPNKKSKKQKDFDKARDQERQERDHQTSLKLYETSTTAEATYSSARSSGGDNTSNLMASSYQYNPQGIMVQPHGPIQYSQNTAIQSHGPPYYNQSASRSSNQYDGQAPDALSQRSNTGFSESSAYSTPFSIGRQTTSSSISSVGDASMREKMSAPSSRSSTWREDN